MHVEVNSLFFGVCISAILIAKYVIPLVIAEIADYKQKLENRKSQLTNELNVATFEYEKNNQEYLRSLEKKVNWIENAQKLFLERKRNMEAEFKAEISYIRKEYQQLLFEARLQNDEKYVDNLIDVMEKYMQGKEQDIDCTKFLNKIDR